MAKSVCSICGRDFDYYGTPPTVDIVKENGEVQTIKVCINHQNLLGSVKKSDERKDD